MSSFRKLSQPALRGLARALRAGHVDRLSTLVPATELDDVHAEVHQLLGEGMAPRHLALLVDELANERAERQSVSNAVELVWSGIETVGARTRDTKVVVQELFARATRSVLVSTYSIAQREEAEELFGPLAARMDAEPELAVQLFVNVPRTYRDDSPDSVIVRAFTDRFRAHIWPGVRMPDVYFDPRSVHREDGAEWACLHAKCVVIDESVAFVSSANLTEAAQARNIEAGVIVTDRVFAAALLRQFVGLVQDGSLARLPI